MSIFDYLSPEKEPRRELTPIEAERLHTVDTGCSRLYQAFEQQFGPFEQKREVAPVMSEMHQPLRPEPEVTGDLEPTQENITDLEAYAKKIAGPTGGIGHDQEVA